MRIGGFRGNEAVCKTSLATRKGKIYRQMATLRRRPQRFHEIVAKKVQKGRVEDSILC